MRFRRGRLEVSAVTSPANCAQTAQTTLQPLLNRIDFDFSSRAFIHWTEHLDGGFRPNPLYFFWMQSCQLENICDLVIYYFVVYATRRSTLIPNGKNYEFTLSQPLHFKTESRKNVYVSHKFKISYQILLYTFLIFHSKKDNKTTFSRWFNRLCNGSIVCSRYRSVYWHTEKNNLS